MATSLLQVAVGLAPSLQQLLLEPASACGTRTSIT